MKIKLQPSQIKIIIVWMLLLVVGGTAFYFFYYNSQADELSRTEQKLEIEKQREKALKQAKNEQEEMDEITMDDLLVQLPEGLDEEAFVQSIERAAKRRKIVVGEYIFEEPTAIFEDKEIIQQVVTLNGQANSTRAIEQFIQQLESEERIIQVSRMTYQEQDADDIGFQAEVIIYGTGKLVNREDG
ncbi:MULTISPECIES: hypothetical protein [Allobacillus]|uniref:Pilus assembly protein PilO n=1 Tax=Allobacillus salarius TaxID=1955272 RepID=A0A556PP75_9BACI|nr:hypothetical protein [Allobacillus salarius]TSJ66183.1 hypothetical protein FPQ13_04740 [Allobacillus salarius]